MEALTTQELAATQMVHHLVTIVQLLEVEEQIEITNTQVA